MQDIQIICWIFKQAAKGHMYATESDAFQHTQISKLSQYFKHPVYHQSHKQWMPWCSHTTKDPRHDVLMNLSFDNQGRI